VREALVSPFRLGRSWKLAATCYIAVMGDPSMVAMCFLALPFLFLVPGKIKVFVLAIGLAVFAVSVVLFWVGSHLEFVVFDIASARAQFVAPSWRRFAPVVWRWIGVKAIFALGIALVCGVPCIFMVKHMIPLFAQASGANPSPAFFLQFLGIFAIVYLVFCVALLFSSLLNDFFLPSFALEQVSMREAARRFAALISSEPGQFFAYVGLKVLLAIVGFIAAYAVVLVCMIPLYILFFIFMMVVTFSVHGIASQLFMIPAMICLEMGILYVSCAAYGALNLFLRCYAVYFLGGHYPMLGDLLDRSTPPPAAPPMYPPPGYFMPPPPPAEPAPNV